MEELTIEQFLKKYYIAYSIEIIKNRAIPSFYDGLKPSQRKVLWTIRNVNKPEKVFILTGKVTSETLYAHGDMSLNQTIIKLSQKFNNNVNLISPFGQFGSRRVPEAGAPRYLSASRSLYYFNVFTDFENIQQLEEENYKIEPKYLLPIFPIAIVNGSFGIAVGFSVNIYPRDPIAVVDFILNYLDNKPLKHIPYKFKEYNGKIESNISYGSYKIKDKETIIIDELPVSMTFESFESHLNKLIDNKTIVSYENKSTDKIYFVIKLKPSKLSEIKNKINNVFKLEEKLQSERFLFIKDDKIIEYTNEIEYLKQWIEFRLEIYEQQKLNIIKKLERDKLILENKIKFVKLIKTRKDWTHEQLLSILEKDFTKVDDSFNYLLRIPISVLIKEEIEKLELDLQVIKDNLNKYYKMDRKELFKNDLLNFKKVLNED